MFQCAVQSNGKNNNIQLNKYMSKALTTLKENIILKTLEHLIDMKT